MQIIEADPDYPAILVLFVHPSLAGIGYKSPAEPGIPAAFGVFESAVGINAIGIYSLYRLFYV